MRRGAPARKSEEPLRGRMAQDIPCAVVAHAGAMNKAEPAGNACKRPPAQGANGALPARGLRLGGEGQLNGKSAAFLQGAAQANIAAVSPHHIARQAEA